MSKFLRGELKKSETDEPVQVDAGKYLSDF